jgi:hypothetical protein
MNFCLRVFGGRVALSALCEGRIETATPRSNSCNEVTFVTVGFDTPRIARGYSTSGSLLFQFLFNLRRRFLRGLQFRMTQARVNLDGAAGEG